jgi:hypothetical protein
MSEDILDASGPHSVTLRMAVSNDRIDTVKIVILPEGSDVDEVDVDHRPIGYVQRAGHVFVALIGDRLSRAEECGQFLLWDQAAAELIRRATRDTPDLVMVGS